MSHGSGKGHRDGMSAIEGDEPTAPAVADGLDAVISPGPRPPKVSAQEREAPGEQ